MLLGVFDRFFESSLFPKWDIEKFDSIFFAILMPHFEELFEIFFWTRIQTRGIDRDFEAFRELRRDHHAHIIAVRTLLTTLWSMLDSADTSEEIAHIIGSFYKWDPLDLTDFHERFIALIILRFWLDIRVIPKAYDIVFISQLEDGHGRIWTTADMDEDFGFWIEYGAIESLFEDIL